MGKKPAKCFKENLSGFDKNLDVPAIVGTEWLV
jgi:hypothetical protein